MIYLRLYKKPQVAVSLTRDNCLMTVAEITSQMRTRYYHLFPNHKYCHNADKGKQAVVWNINDYTNKPEKHLASSTYIECDSNTLLLAKTNVTSIVKKYLPKNIIDTDTANKLTTKAPKPVKIIESTQDLLELLRTPESLGYNFDVLNIERVKSSVYNSSDLHLVMAIVSGLCQDAKSPVINDLWSCHLQIPTKKSRRDLLLLQNKKAVIPARCILSMCIITWTPCDTWCSLKYQCVF
ncbi:hypothetical protein GJ496_002575 [Pomphorhynchus laevis]|nr:hypothetical protein GJ496_002575 [Pomphorhynchus laevis]